MKAVTMYNLKCRLDKHFVLFECEKTNVYRLDKGVDEIRLRDMTHICPVFLHKIEHNQGSD